MKKKNEHQSKLTRREALEALGAVAAVALTAACSSESAASTTSPDATPGGSTASGCAVTPSETEGPYADRLGMINNQAYFRRDITEGKPGLPLALVLTIVNTNRSCQAVSNAVVEVWQCDATGNYSEYAQPGFNGVGQTFLRGLQTSDASGQVTFNTIYPGLVRRPSDAYSRRRVREWHGREDDADCLSGSDESSRVCDGRLRRKGTEFDDQRARTTCSPMDYHSNWRRYGQHRQWIHRHVDHRRRDLRLTRPRPVYGETVKPPRILRWARPSAAFSHNSAPMNFRCLVLAGALFATVSLPSVAGAQPAGTEPDPRFARLEYWVQTVLEHEPGRSDSRIVTIVSWWSSRSQHARHRRRRPCAGDAAALAAAVFEQARRRPVATDSVHRESGSALA